MFDFFCKKNRFYGNSTTRTSSTFPAILPNFRQNPAYVALFREKTLNRYFSPLWLGPGRAGSRPGQHPAHEDKSEGAIRDDSLELFGYTLIFVDIIW